MSILDDILGGGNNSGESMTSTGIGTAIETSPGLAFGAADILAFESQDGEDGSSFTGIGAIGLGLSAPTSIGLEASNETYNEDGGGLLGGLL
jgi:hypothetical protein